MVIIKKDYWDYW